MIELRFWTDGIAAGGKIRPRHAWASGVARMERNDAHGIRSGDPIPFNSLLEVGTAIQGTLIAHGVVLLPPPRMAK